MDAEKSYRRERFLSSTVGQFTIPAQIRREMGIREGDVFSLIRLGDTLIATRKRLVAQEVARAIEALVEEEGISLEDLLEGLKEERKIRPIYAECPYRIPQFPSSWTSISLNSPVSVKTTRSQMLVTRSAARSRLWATQRRCVARSMVVGSAIMESSSSR